MHGAGGVGTMRLRRMTALSYYELSRVICVRHTRSADRRAIIARVDVAETQSVSSSRGRIWLHKDWSAIMTSERRSIVHIALLTMLREWKWIKAVISCPTYSCQSTLLSLNSPMKTIFANDELKITSPKNLNTLWMLENEKREGS